MYGSKNLNKSTEMSQKPRVFENTQWCVPKGDELLSKQKGVANAANKKTGMTMPQRVYII